MGKCFHTNRNFILDLLVILTLITPGLLAAGQSEGQPAPPPSTSSSEVINALARQIAFVKTFSTDFSYQYEPESGKSERGHTRSNTNK
jgi:hypothetical protein